MAQAVFCSYEMTSFPPEQFKHYEEYGTVHEHPPGDKTPKHTVTGQLLPTEPGAVKTWPVPSTAFPAE
jgi:hypothetical protein